MGNETISCLVEDIKYTNEDNGYTVIDASYDDGSNYFTAVGILPYVRPGQHLKITGYWTTHFDYGDQFRVEYYEMSAPADKEAIFNYLASGAVEGVREATAKKLVDAFGADTLEVISKQPEKLAGLKGISLDKAKKISKSYNETRSMQDLLLFLQKYGISLSAAMKIYNVFGTKALGIIEQNPYAISDLVSGISFNTADIIAYNMGIPKNDPVRVRSGIKYILQTAAYRDGHTYMPGQLLKEDAAYKLTISEDEAERALLSLAGDEEIKSDIIDRENVYFLRELFEAEMYIASRLALMAHMPQKHTLSPILAEERIDALSGGTELAAEQKNAVITAVSTGCMVLTGGPGTGKTTTVNTIIKILEDMKLSVALAAPTGRAAKRLSQVTGLEAKTIHRLLGSEYKNGVHTFSFNEKHPLSYDAVILDEVSMVDTPLMQSFLRAVKTGARVILCGDSDQLPSIGPGSVLKDIIESCAVPVIKLTKIFRQAEQSLIIVNAHRINRGEMPELNTKTNDFFCLRRGTPEQIVSTIRDLFVKRLPKSYDVDPVFGIQVLSPTKKGDTGTVNLNRILQEAYNPPSPEKAEFAFGHLSFREGDKVMQTKNNYDISYTLPDGKESSGIFNGDMGIITSINTERKYMDILFDEEKSVEYPFSMLDDLDLSYAVTVHKSQGSEFPIIVMAAGKYMPRLMTRNLFYTAVTRAKDIVILVGSERTIMNMTANAYTKRRFTALSQRLADVKASLEDEKAKRNAKI
ncbi:MAG TPA: ATP-dependent RecD-like DNA helicase [Candidatus Ornithomonoglobus intestinigallinarum]|uniref:ATP-dependent RecD2 DNA helicase n=1 Tax=Candidatus Ornithomonoglobus intestinigallinarum TaxID=2840894 RepID=A0A9D1KQ70_9FIRM|nr:ATP-dependent RecD-like DNA helicase [Candidatus Ornithomonoglobus intestinigallinarum]